MGPPSPEARSVGSHTPLRPQPRPRARPRPPYHTLGVHQKQVLGLPRVHACEHVLPGVGDAVAHEEVPVGSQQFLRRPAAHLAVVPRLLPQLLLCGGDGGPAGRGAGPLVLQGKGGCRARGHGALVQLQRILEGS